MNGIVVPKKLCIKQFAGLSCKGQSTLRRWAKIWLNPNIPGKKRGPQPYQPDGPGTAVFYLEHEVRAYLDPSYCHSVETSATLLAKH